MNQEDKRLIDKIVNTWKIRLTRQRKAVLETLIENRHRHISFDEIYMQARRKCSSIGISTVYRNIDMLEKAGAIVKNDFGADAAVYEFVEESDRNHHHMICRECGKVLEISDIIPYEVKEKILNELGFECREYSLNIFGLCSECRKKIGKSGG